MFQNLGWGEFIKQGRKIIDHRGKTDKLFYIKIENIVYQKFLKQE